MRVSVLNVTGGTLRDEDLHDYIRAINRQIAEDFEPFWSIDGSVRLAGKSDEDGILTPRRVLNADALIYISRGAEDSDQIHRHLALNPGLAHGLVRFQRPTDRGDEWTVGLSREVLSLLADPFANRLVAGPHPRFREREVFHWLEVCDAVGPDHYYVEGVMVANFVLPAYYGRGVGERTDFLGGEPLDPFGTKMGGQIGFFDPFAGGPEVFPEEEPLMGTVSAEDENAFLGCKPRRTWRGYKPRPELARAGMAKVHNVIPFG